MPYSDTLFLNLLSRVEHGFGRLEEGQKLTVYRGISLAPNADPTSSNKDGQGTGSSWPMIEVRSVTALG